MGKEDHLCGGGGSCLLYVGLCLSITPSSLVPDWLSGNSILLSILLQTVSFTKEDNGCMESPVFKELIIVALRKYTNQGEEMPW